MKIVVNGGNLNSARHDDDDERQEEHERDVEDAL